MHTRFKLTLIVLLTGLIFLANPLHAGEYEKSVLTVDGHGEITVSPDIAYLNISVETNSKNAKDAVSENSQKINNVLSTLKPMTGPNDTLKTTEYSLHPVYEYDENRKKSFLTSYRVTSEVRLKTFLIDKLGRIIDAATDAGANRINGPAFDNSERDKNKRKALARAVEDAKETARAVAEAAGVELVKIVRINPSYNYPLPIYKQNLRTARVAESSDAPSIEPGDLTVEANVSMVYEIRQ